MERFGSLQLSHPIDGRVHQRTSFGCINPILVPHPSLGLTFSLLKGIVVEASEVSQLSFSPFPFPSPRPRPETALPSDLLMGLLSHPLSIAESHLPTGVLRETCLPLGRHCPCPHASCTHRYVLLQETVPEGGLQSERHLPEGRMAERHSHGGKTRFSCSPLWSPLHNEDLLNEPLSELTGNIPRSLVSLILMHG